MYVPFEALYNTVTNRKAEPSSSANLFSGKKRLKNLIKNRLWDANSSILYFNDNHSVFGNSFQRYPFVSTLVIRFFPLCFNGVPRINEQVNEDLLQSIGTSKNGREIFLQVHFYLYFP